MPGVGDLAVMKAKPRTPWLWKDYIPRVGITLIQGDKGVGKSTVISSIASYVTNGLAFPGSDEALLPASGVAYLQKEADEVVALDRMIAAGVNEKKLYPLVADSKGHWEFPRDFKLLADFVSENRVKVLIMDPWYDFVAPQWKQRSTLVRDIANKFVEFAQKHRIAIIALTHLNKNTKQAASLRSQGAAGFAEVSRSLLAVGIDPRDADTHVLAGVRVSDAKDPVSRTFRQVTVVLPDVDTEDGSDYEVVACEWTGTTDLQSDDLLTERRNTSSTHANGRSAPRDFAKEFLIEWLAEGPQLVSDTYVECKKRFGTSEVTFKRARADIGVLSVSRKGTKKKYIALPGKTDFPAQVSKPKKPLPRKLTNSFSAPQEVAKAADMTPPTRRKKVHPLNPHRTITAQVSKWSKTLGEVAAMSTMTLFKMHRNGEFSEEDYARIEAYREKHRQGAVEAMKTQDPKPTKAMAVKVAQRRSQKARGTIKAGAPGTKQQMYVDSIRKGNPYGTRIREFWRTKDINALMSLPRIEIDELYERGLLTVEQYEDLLL